MATPSNVFRSAALFNLLRTPKLRHELGEFVSDQESIASEMRFRSLVGSCFTSSQLPNNRGQFRDIALALWSTASS
jgi:hypothetical protein